MSMGRGCPPPFPPPAPWGAKRRWENLGGLLLNVCPQLPQWGPLLLALGLL